MTYSLSKWIDTQKKQTYPNEWSKERIPWSRKIPNKELPQTILKL